MCTATSLHVPNHRRHVAEVLEAPGHAVAELYTSVRVTTTIETHFLSRTLNPSSDNVIIGVSLRLLPTYAHDRKQAADGRRNAATTQKTDTCLRSRACATKEKQAGDRNTTEQNRVIAPAPNCGARSRRPEVCVANGARQHREDSRKDKKRTHTLKPANVMLWARNEGR